MGSVLLSGDAFGFVMFLVIGGGVVALIIWSIHHQKKVRENWLMFARKNGLQIQGSTNRPVIQGWLGQVYITLNTVVRGSGKNRTTYTQYHASVNAPMPRGLGLYKEGLFSKVGKMFGGQDVQVGDRMIDDAFIIKADDLLGTHNLLSLPPVKKALLYCIARHPGLRITERNILVEHTGMTGDLTKITGVFEDLSYLALTFDAGYQQLSGARPAQQNVRTVETPKRSSVAEVLGEDALGFDTRSSGAQTRQAKPDEDPALRAAADILGRDAGFAAGTSPIQKQALSDMASAFNQYAEKLASGEAAPQPRKAPNLEDAFAKQEGEQQAFESSQSYAFDSFAPDSDRGESSYASFDSSSYSFESRVESNDSAFATPDAGSAFDNPEPFEADKPFEESFPEPKPATAPKSAAPDAGGLDGLLVKLSDGALLSGDRERIIKENAGNSYEVELVVDRVDNTWGFDVPDALRDGKTVEAHNADGKPFLVRFPKSRNDEVGKLGSGTPLKTMGKLSAWDDLFKKATLDVE
ncbi:MAG: hypothetical protein KDB82_06905 [Planctomycetes bacterium]|nr:hypothetical protein [Planctomycetota bacterium]